MQRLVKTSTTVHGNWPCSQFGKFHCFVKNSVLTATKFVILHNFEVKKAILSRSESHALAYWIHCKQRPEIRIDSQTINPSLTKLFHLSAEAEKFTDLKKSLKVTAAIW